jgi:hypothetical protein
MAILGPQPPTRHGPRIWTSLMWSMTKSKPRIIEVHDHGVVGDVEQRHCVVV